MSEQVKQSKKKANPASRLPIPGPGRPKGSKDKISKNIKDNFEAVFEKLGGIDGFYAWAKKLGNQGHFYQMYSKMLPSNVDVAGVLSLTYEVSEKFLPDIKPETTVEGKIGLKSEEEKTD